MSTIYVQCVDSKYIRPPTEKERPMHSRSIYFTDREVWALKRERLGKKITPISVDPGLPLFAARKGHAAFGPIGQDGTLVNRICPYGDKGQVLWVQEAFCLPHTGTPNQLTDFDDVRYRADSSQSDLDDPSTHWRKAVHMPGWASRFHLVVTEVKFLKLHDITDDDCFNCGVFGPTLSDMARLPKNEYQEIWDELYYGHKLFAWKTNPWVCMTSFKRLL